MAEITIGQVAAQLVQQQGLIAQQQQTIASNLAQRDGRKKNSDELEHQHLVKALAQGLINDRDQHRSTYGYYNATFSQNLCSSLVRIMKNDPALANVMRG